MKVPFFDMAAELAPIRTDIDAAIARTLDSGIFIGGPEMSTCTDAHHAIVNQVRWSDGSLE